MSENTQNQNPKQEQYSLNDDRRVKVLSPGALVAKRFFRNRLAVVGLSILVAMFLFSFVGGLVSPYGQDEQFFTYTQMSKEYVGVTRNDKLRFVVADGQEFGSIAQSKGNEAYFQKILEHVKQSVGPSNSVFGEYMCQGKMPQSVRDRYMKMKTQPEHPANIDALIENFDRALSHPDEDDLERLRKIVLDRQ